MACGLLIIAVGFGIGLRPMYDNSFLTHLATGRLILESGSVPSSDPYTFTANGEPWVVQSWLASWLYATVERFGGLAALRTLMGLTAGVLAALAWRLTRPASSVLVRLGLAALALAVGSGLWAERPFMLGLVALGLVALAGDGALDARWLAPLGWMWTNAHGSFPLGVAYLVVVAAGAWADQRTWDVERRSLGWLSLGIALGAVGPVGPRVLVFPVELLQRQQVLEHVIEWQAPTFTSFAQRAFLLQLLLAVLLLAHRPTWRRALVIVVFGGAALLGARNVPVASVLFLAPMAQAADDIGGLASSERSLLSRLVAILGVAIILLVGVVRFQQPDLRLRSYPIDALAFLEQHDIDTTVGRLVTPDVVGNVQELIFGPGDRVFYDDRFDMFPSAVSDDHVTLVEASPAVHAALADHDAALVLWRADGALSTVLTADPAWRTLYVDESWVLHCRRGASLGATYGPC